MLVVPVASLTAAFSQHSHVVMHKGGSIGAGLCAGGGEMRQMGRKFMAALMAAAALLPGVSAAQERGGRSFGAGAQQQRGDGGGRWQRAAPQPRAAERQASRAAERNWGRSAAEARGPAREAGAVRTWQRSSAIDGRGAERQSQAQAQAQAQSGAERQWPRSTTQVRSGLTARADPLRTEAPGTFRQDRREDRRDFRAERRADRQALTAGAVTRDAFRADRARDVEAFRRDRAADRDDRVRDLGRDRRGETSRNWARSSADWNDHDRWNASRQGWGEQRGWGDQRGWGEQRGWNGRAGWNRDWRRDSRYDWARWRAANRGAFHLPRYYAPYGWNRGYNRFSVGVILSSVLFAQNYWINDPWAYRLPEADGDLRWVRYYNDALLVDLYSGEVVDVIHDMFW